MATTEEQIINYVLKTPNNTNPQILRQLLEDRGSGGTSDYNDLENKPLIYDEDRGVYTTNNGTAIKVAEDGVYSGIYPTGFVFDCNANVHPIILIGSDGFNITATDYQNGKPFLEADPLLNYGYYARFGPAIHVGSQTVGNETVHGIMGFNGELANYDPATAEPALTIRGVVEPVLGSDVATKAYVDNHLSSNIYVLDLASLGSGHDLGENITEYNQPEICAAIANANVIILKGTQQSQNAICYPYIKYGSANELMVIEYMLYTSTTTTTNYYKIEIWASSPSPS